MKLSEEQITENVEKLDKWERDDEKWMSKKYRFTTFKEAIRFVNRVADIAEEMNHHPMISIDFRLVTIRLTSWKAKGLTMLDFDSAKAYDEAYTALEGSD
jgi:4a-hydroxytetrahydrobiopterin dehydratase